MFFYTARQLNRYHAWCKANPTGQVLPPRGRRDWDEMPAARWLAWFWDCLTEKINSHLPPAGRGNRARRRVRELANRAAECKWCGQKTGAANRRFCDASCARAWGGDLWR